MQTTQFHLTVACSYLFFANIDRIGTHCEIRGVEFFRTWRWPPIFVDQGVTIVTLLNCRLQSDASTSNHRALLSIATMKWHFAANNK